jgi:tetratricopeptide (TPR) repeat protein
MRRFLTPSNVIAVVIIAGVAAVVSYANWNERRQTRARAAAPARTATHVSTSREDLQRTIQTFEAQLVKHPEDVRTAVALADALVRQTRVTGHAGLAMRAEKILKRALVEDPGNYDASRALASAYLSQHRFHEAVAIGEKNRDQRPYDAMNYAMIGDGRLELGEYDQAFDAFDRMMLLRPSASSYARVAYARELQGNLRGALESMQLAADATDVTDREGLAWTRAQIGDLYVQLGDIHQAKIAYSAASQAFPGHPHAVIGYARVVAAEGDAAAALGLLQELQRTAPTPELAARIGDLLESLGRHEEAERQFALAEAGWRSEVSEPKNLARFLADHGKPEQAVIVAEQAAASRHDIFTDDALAWAYFRSGRLEDARRMIGQALRTGTRDREIRLHAESIAAAAPRVAAR